MEIQPLQMSLKMFITQYQKLTKAELSRKNL